MFNLQLHPPFRIGLVAQFHLIGSAIGLLLAAAMVSIIESRVTNLAIEQVSRRAIDHVELAVMHHLTPGDFEPELSSAARAQLAERLDPLFQLASANGSGVVRQYVYARDGTVLYSDEVDRRGIRRPTDTPPFAAALAGSVGTNFGSHTWSENADLMERYGDVLGVYVPVVIDGRVVGVYEIYQDPAPVRAVGWLIWGTAVPGLGILLLTLSLFVRRAATLVRRQEIERERADEALRNSEKRFRALIEHSSDGFWLLSADGTILETSPSSGRVFGYTGEDLAGRNVAEILHPDCRQSVVDILSAVAATADRVATLEFQARRGDGQWRWIEAVARNLLAEPAVRAIAATCRDTTNRRRALEALRASEERYRGLFENASDIVYTLDLEGIVTSVNKAAERITGYTAEEGIGQNIFQFVAPEYHSRADDALKKKLEHGGPTTYEVEILAKDGHRVPIEVNTHLLIEGSRPVGVLGIARDITERKQTERQQEALAQTEKVRALGQMASGVAHDLNQYLALVAGQGDLAMYALDRPSLDLAHVRECLEIMVEAAMDGADVVRRLLTFARPRHEGPPGPVDVGGLLHEVARLTAPNWRDAAQAQGRPIALDIRVDGDTTMTGWVGSLREALTNLVFNAVDALPAGGTIRLSAVRRGTVVEVAVADTGMGMSEELKARIFEPYFSTKGERGTGLGLAIVLSIVVQHQGQITVESQPGKGTTFRLSIPSASASSPDHASPPTQNRVRSFRILAVDDQPAISAMLSSMLAAEGHQVTVAGSGAEALQRFRADSFDIVISDLGLGAGMNGWDLAAEIRTHSPNVRIILATGWGAQIDPAQARAHGITSVVPKPYRLADLRNAIAASVNGTR